MAGLTELSEFCIESPKGSILGDPGADSRDGTRLGLAKVPYKLSLVPIVVPSPLSPPGSPRMERE